MTYSAGVPSIISEDNAAIRVLDMLDHWSDRMVGHYSQKRGAARKVFRGNLILFFPEDEETVGEAVDKSILEVWSRNISKSGIAFITREIIRADEFVACLQGQNEQSIYIQSVMIRNRQVHDQFWEYGAEFKERAHM